MKQNDNNNKNPYGNVFLDLDSEKEKIYLKKLTDENDDFSKLVVNRSGSLLKEIKSYWNS